MAWRVSPNVKVSRKPYPGAPRSEETVYPPGSLLPFEPPPWLVASGRVERVADAPGPPPPAPASEKEE